MFTFFEVFKMDAEIRWLEIKAGDTENDGPVTVRLPVDDYHQMAAAFVKRYQAKRAQELEVPHTQAVMIEEFFQEACMARVMAGGGNTSPDLVDLLPTTIIDFRYPEKTSFRKSRSTRIQMFLEEALTLLHQRDFETALHRLAWVHLLEESNEYAFELEIVCLRSWKKMPECIPVFEAWIQNHPKAVEPRLGLSEMWLFLDQNQRARESFETLLTMEPGNCLALIGLAQARIKLGEDPLPELRKASIINSELTREMVERDFDFRVFKPERLVPKKLKEISETYLIPLNRVMERAARGVLPMHPPGEDQLFRFSEEELNRHYQVLRCLGLELGSSTPLAELTEEEPQIIQPGLFDD